MTDLPPPPMADPFGDQATKPAWWKRRWVQITGGVLVAMLVLGAIFGEDDDAATDDASPPTATAENEDQDEPELEPETTTTTEAPTPEVDEAAEFLAFATEQMELNGSDARFYLTGEAQIVADWLIVNAQLNRSDSDQASAVCGNLVSASYSYPGEMSWRIVQIEPLDGGVAAECERRTN